MTRTERVLARRWRSFALVATLLILGGAILMVYLQIQDQSRKAAALATEANLRGTAVSTLAGDVRALRQQVQSKGGTPVAPDPTRAVPSLTDRAAVPVPIPGPQGPPGPAGKPAPTITPSPGPSGARGVSGEPGADSTVPGPSGQPGADSTVMGPTGPAGRDGADGKNGQDGSPPAGWTWAWTDQAGVTHVYDCEPVSNFDKNNPKYQCTETSTSTPAPTNSPSPTSQGLLGLALVGDRRRWL